MDITIAFEYWARAEHDCEPNDQPNIIMDKVFGGESKEGKH